MSQCFCETQEHPAALSIPAGLDWLPRQIAGFPEFRHAMLSSIPSHSALASWRGRDENDLGILVLEMWAYVADVLAFYDEVIANELYLRTAQNRSSLRKLVNLLGYIPKPAVAATVELACLADGRQPISLPIGTAFRSAAFESEKPQVFELEKAAAIHPFTSQWLLQAPRATAVENNHPTTLNVIPATQLKKDMPILIRVELPAAWVIWSFLLGDYYTHVRRLDDPSDQKASDGTAYQVLSLTSASVLDTIVPLAYITLEVPNQTAKLCTIDTSITAILASGSATKLTLDSLYPALKAGDYILLEKGTNLRWFKVTQVAQTMAATSSATTVTINGSSFKTPGTSTPVTQVLLDVDINHSSRRGSQASWTDSDKEIITLHYGMVSAGRMYAPPRTVLAPADSLAVKGQPETPAKTYQPKRFMLEDKNQNGTAVKGVLNFTSGKLTLGSSTSWSPDLTLPVKLYGNIVKASRGETVSEEILGSGDGSESNQSFTLKKSPLTYLSAPGINEQGVASTLKVYVDGLEWKEAASFYNAGPSDEIYILRQDDEGKTSVIFGDGQRGSRLPSGTDNVTARYRYGAGKAVPPVGGITQLGKPVKGLTSVRSPVKGSGGEDAESAGKIAQYGPRSALLLGRVVSMDDILVAACRVSGVRAAQAEWRWNGERQQPVAQVWYIGSSGLEEDILTRIHALSEPNLPVDAKAATAVPLTLTLDLEVDSRRVKQTVLAAVRSALMDTTKGLLPPERIGIGCLLYRSRVFAAVLGVAGVNSVTEIRAAYSGIEGAWSSFAIQPGSGCYFDIEQGGLTLSGEEG